MPGFARLRGFDLLTLRETSARMLTLCGQSFEPVWTDFGGGINRTPEWRARVNAIGEILVLEDSGVRFTQTAPIFLRLSSRYRKFAGNTDGDRFEILRRLFWDNHKLTGYMATYRFQRAFTSSPDQTVLRFLRRRIDDFVIILETHLSSRVFVIGAEPTIANISMVGYLLFPTHESGYELNSVAPFNRPMAQPRRGHSWVARSLRSPAWKANALLCRCAGRRRSRSLFGVSLK
jgi:glutathione S-transferase